LLQDTKTPPLAKTAISVATYLADLLPVHTFCLLFSLHRISEIKTRSAPNIIKQQEIDHLPG